MIDLEGAETPDIFINPTGTSMEGPSGPWCWPLLAVVTQLLRLFVSLLLNVVLDIVGG